MDKNYKLEDFAHLHWGGLSEYLDIVAENPSYPQLFSENQRYDSPMKK